MEFLDPKQKRRRDQRLFLGYFLFVIVILMATIILVYRASGFSFDRKTGTVILNGLLFIETVPESAEINIDGVQRREGMDTRISLPAGNHRILLTRDGYRPWQKDVLLDGGRVEQLRYPRLFPDKMTATAVTTYSAPPLFFSQSIDYKWVVVGVEGASRQFEVYDTTKSTVTPATSTFDEVCIQPQFSLNPW